VAKFSLRRFDVQAKTSVVVSLMSVVSLLGLIGVVLRRFDFNELVIYYGSPTKMAVYAATAVTLLLSAIGLAMGFNSVGQRRNDKQAWSWAGFFMGAGVFCAALVVFYLFRARGQIAI
jgi:hypothetical protein